MPIFNLDFLSYSRNACRDQETHNIQTEIIQQRVSQFSEPSSRRGSIGVSIKKKEINVQGQFVCKQL
jgi:hypothetical protein